MTVALYQKVSLIAALGLAIAAGSLTAAPTASANEMGSQASGCKFWKSQSAPWTAFASCTDTDFKAFRIIVECAGPSGSPFTKRGSWALMRGTSKAKCSDNPNVGIARMGVQKTKL